MPRFPRCRYPGTLACVSVPAARSCISDCGCQSEQNGLVAQEPPFCSGQSGILRSFCSGRLGRLGEAPPPPRSSSGSPSHKEEGPKIKERRTRYHFGAVIFTS